VSWWQQRFFQISLPVIVVFAIATWRQNKRNQRDAMNRRLVQVGKRSGAIERHLARI